MLFTALRTQNATIGSTTRGDLDKVQDNVDTRLGQAIIPLAQAHPGLSGIVGLPDGRNAFATRVLLAEAAERTLDVQYYIWRNDLSGTLLAEAVRRAADRGVRVRMLLDDNGTAGVDAELVVLDSHPNIEIRLFNPFRIRRFRPLNYLTDFARLNRRMHNKSFTADNVATIVGGRNVGDEYFDATEEVSFADLDVLAVGPVVNRVSEDFERYWTCESAHRVDKVLPPVDEATRDKLASTESLVKNNPAAKAYLDAVASSPFTHDLLEHTLPFEWAVAHLVSDDPSKGLGRARKKDLLWSRLKDVLGRPTQEIQLISPYFVPGAVGVEFFCELARSGVNTVVLTNSLEATDVPAVHSGYAKRRKPLLEGGVKLFEMKRSITAPARRSGPRGSSNASLHAKTFTVDRSRIFVGSFNFDPRSAKLNTEMGFVIESPALARTMSDALIRDIPERAYEVRLSDRGRLQWHERRDGTEIVHDREPHTTLFRRASVAALSVLPIEWLL